MIQTLFADFNYFDFLILPFLIFLARICDVTIGTIRIIMVSRGQRRLAPILGFFEVLIWLVAIGRIMQNLDNWMCYIFYAAGFATGNYIGILLEERLAVGIVQLQIITQKDSSKLIKALKDAGYGITHHNAEGGVSGRWVSIIYSIVKRTELEKVVGLILEHNPNAFYSIGDVRFVNKDLPTAMPGHQRFLGIRLGK
jgi:uncharacterized protein YebE (UPF0316 family)